MFTRASLLVAGLVAGLTAALTAAGPAAAASTVVNDGGSVTVAQVEWAFEDDGTFIGGYLVAAQDRTGGTVIESFLYTETVVQCEGAETPDDPTDDRFDFQLVLESGLGSATTFDIGRSYSGAHAAGDLTIVADRFDGCTGELVTEVLADVPVSLDVVGTGPLVREGGHGYFHIPSEINVRGSSRQTYRDGDGAAVIGAQAYHGDGAVGSVTWREHLNGG